MASSTSAFHDRTERCEHCGQETRHDVGVEIRTEGGADDVGFSREPYRVATCIVCGTEQVQRMNDA